ncbi:PrgI family protein [Paenibacillus alvei]|uniref:PrgI family protein n=1 Tax=Paenibacillus alvei TaxID=44250 RepID=UPI000288355F|nr:PrgI family protein [Paenibacillus alvei]EJW13862.1 hypothetical protein PAV_109p00920 [Paenibacillus alvei DSM 29]MCY9544995.1 PrgI family protein [Paenibacillus alvei]MCY9708326.1 PrgI family protein [Paenibacillus alvei]MCY9732986.1 PrgI family protein [Paenibacillus alvei]MCY9755248.1 PrgI family protein [Paenibacillus alvei]
MGNELYDEDDFASKNETVYFIPKNVRSRFEFLPGFGVRELLITLTGAVIGLAIAFIVYLFTQHILSFVLVGLVGGLSFFLAKPDPRTGKNALDLLKDIQSYKSRPKRYFYRYGDGRG